MIHIHYIRNLSKGLNLNTCGSHQHTALGSIRPSSSAPGDHAGAASWRHLSSPPIVEAEVDEFNDICLEYQDAEDTLYIASSDLADARNRYFAFYLAHWDGGAAGPFDGYLRVASREERAALREFLNHTCLTTAGVAHLLNIPEDAVCAMARLATSPGTLLDDGVTLCCGLTAFRYFGQWWFPRADLSRLLAGPMADGDDATMTAS